MGGGTSCSSLTMVGPPEFSSKGSALTHLSGIQNEVTVNSAAKHGSEGGAGLLLESLTVSQEPW